MMFFICSFSRESFFKALLSENCFVTNSLYSAEKLRLALILNTKAVNFFHYKRMFFVFALLNDLARGKDLLNQTPLTFPPAVNGFHANGSPLHQTEPSHAVVRKASTDQQVRPLARLFI